MSSMILCIREFKLLYDFFIVSHVMNVVLLLRRGDLGLSSVIKDLRWRENVFLRQLWKLSHLWLSLKIWSTLDGVTKRSS